MGRFTFGVILGLAIGIIDVLLMLPLAFAIMAGTCRPSVATRPPMR